MGMTEAAGMKTERYIQALEILNYLLFLVLSPSVGPFSSGDHSNGTTGLGVDARDI